MPFRLTSLGCWEDIDLTVPFGSPSQIASRAAGIITIPKKRMFIGFMGPGPSVSLHVFH
jgi:hypothetical protein